MNYLDWHVGMKVVCVDPRWGAEGDIQRLCCPNLPRKGGVYTIRSLECARIVRGRPPELLIRLNEVINPVRYEQEPVFLASKFRPVQPRKSDISIFTSILTGKRTKVDA